LELVPLACAIVAYVEVSTQHERRLRERWSYYGRPARQLLLLGLTFRGSEYLCAQQYRFAMNALYARLIGSHEYVITPTVPVTAPPRGGYVDVPGEEGVLGLFSLIRFTALANFIVRPAISLPAGVAEDGLPVGMQIMGQPFRDAE